MFVCVGVYTCLHIYLSMYMHARMHACMFACIHTWTHTFVRASDRPSVDRSIDACICQQLPGFLRTDGSMAEPVDMAVCAVSGVQLRQLFFVFQRLMAHSNARHVHGQLRVAVPAGFLIRHEIRRGGFCT